MKKTSRKLFPLFLSLILLLAGCGSASKNFESMDSSAADSEGWTQETDYEYTEDVSSEENAEVSEDVLPENDLEHRKLIRTIHLDMQTKGFDTLMEQLDESIQKHGGYIENSSIDTPQYENAKRSCSLTIRIPSEQLDSFLTFAGTLGSITYQTETKEDVTLDYVDITTLKESLTVEYERVTQLLEEASDIEQILALESKLSDLRYELNRLDSRIRTYDNLIDYSTVYMEIREVEFEKVVEESVWSQIQNQFTASLYTVRDFFIDVFISITGNFPVILLIIVLICIFIFIIRKCHKRSKRKKEEKKLKKSMAKTPLPEQTQSEQKETKTP